MKYNVWLRRNKGKKELCAGMWPADGQVARALYGKKRKKRRK